MLINDIIQILERIAPPSLQEDYDNAGLITGEAEQLCTGVIICLDTTEEIIREAMDKKCNLVVSHHPIIFRGLKRLTGKNYVERTVISAIRNGIAIYAIHTNLDNVLHGVNSMIAQKLGLQKTEILQPKASLLNKLVTFVPAAHARKVSDALFAAGAGALGKYSECSFYSEGTGTFKPMEGADPFIGKIGERHEEKEVKLEVIFPAYLKHKITEAMRKSHPYEEVAYDIISLGNYLSDTGSGITGELESPLSENDLLLLIKKAFGLPVIKHTGLLNKKVKKIAVCGGAGSFLLKDAMASRAEVFITSDIKYHEYFDAEGKILLCDIGHYESEQFTITLLYDILTRNFPNFAVLKTGVVTNPVHYFTG